MPIYLLQARKVYCKLQNRLIFDVCEHLVTSVNILTGRKI